MDIAIADKLATVWKRAYLLFKPFEARVEKARAQLVALLVTSGVTEFASKFGTISMQTKKTTNWEKLARAIIKPELLEQALPQFTSESAPFLRAPASWSGEAKR